MTGWGGYFERTVVCNTERPTQSAAMSAAFRGESVRIASIQLDLISPNEIMRRSVLGITHPGLCEQNLPKVGSINDHRMGPVDRRVRCGTCFNMVDKCTGHIGHLTLAYPVYHPAFIKNILATLRRVCFFCSAILLNTQRQGEESPVPAVIACDPSPVTLPAKRKEGTGEPKRQKAGSKKGQALQGPCLCGLPRPAARI